jgi:CubicO group peptidase (beta-lactamase class C family)
MSPKVDESMIQGMVAPGFEKVKEEFIRNFKERGDIGAAVAAYRNNEKVVDLWGGYRDVKSKAPWEENTLVNVFSSTMGVSSLAVAVAHSQGLFDYDEKVSTYWPEFAQNGKENITVRQLLSHQAGLPAIDEPLNQETLADLDKLAEALAKQKPAWEPSTKHGYHAITLGWYEGELIRRVDPQKRSLGQFFQNEVAKPLDIEFYIGLPKDVPDSQLANIHAPLFTFRMLFNMGKLPKEFVKAFVLSPKSLTARSLSNPKLTAKPLKYNLREIRALELPASNGHGNARSIARAYGIFAAGGSELGIKPETLQELATPAAPPSSGTFDEVLKLDMSFSLGYCKPSPDFRFGTNEKAFGTPGAGGSFGFADPDAGIGFAYVMTNMGFYIFNDPREKILRDTVYECSG